MAAHAALRLRKEPLCRHRHAPSLRTCTAATGILPAPSIRAELIDPDFFLEIMNGSRARDSAQ
jgi:hypothetical protein